VPSRYDLVLIGDSLTEEWQSTGAATWEALFADRTLNLGVGGDRTGDVLHRIENGALDGLSARVAVLLAGTNDLGNGVPPATVFGGVAACARAIAARLPGAQLLVLGILPRGSGGPGGPMRRAVASVNARLSTLDDGRRVHYLDIGDAFLDPAGSVRLELFDPDLLHLAPAGYRAWGQALQPPLDALLRSPSS
jgi:beta-glucosidase